MSSLMSTFCYEVGVTKGEELVTLFNAYKHDPVELHTAVHEFVSECQLDASEVLELIEELHACDFSNREKRVADLVCESLEEYTVFNPSEFLWDTRVDDFFGEDDFSPSF